MKQNAQFCFIRSGFSLKFIAIGAHN